MKKILGEKIFFYESRNDSKIKIIVFKGDL